MFNRIDASKSTKGASKLRRDLINAEIANLRDLLPLPASTRQRLSQLQLMALVCVFLRKANYFQQVLKNEQESAGAMPTPNIGFSKAMTGFIMMMTQQGKLLYVSENAAEYLGHSMEDLLIHGDSVYDVVDRQDHMVIQNQLTRNGPGTPEDRRLFLCRINVSRNSRRQLRFGDQKVVLVEGHYLPFVPLCSRNELVFLASCTPVVLPETRESVVQGATNIFTSIHSMDMKYLHIDKTGESHLEYPRSELLGVSWYNLIHWDSIRSAYAKHQTVIQSDQERSSTVLIKLHSRSGRWFWAHCVLQVKDTSDVCQHPVIVCTNQVLSEKEAEIMRNSSWLYQYSSQSKFNYGACPSGTSNNQTAQPPSIPQQQQQQQPGGYEHIPDYPRGPNEAPAVNYTSEVQSYQQQSLDESADWSKSNDNVKQEPAEAPAAPPPPPPPADPAIRLRGQEEAEPVDMSISSSDCPEEHHKNGHAPDYCACNEAQLHLVQRANDKSPSMPCIIPPYPCSPPKLPGTYAEEHPQSLPSSDHNSSVKYHIVDLDKLNQNQPESDIYGPNYSTKRQYLHHQHPKTFISDEPCQGAAPASESPYHQQHQQTYPLQHEMSGGPVASQQQQHHHPQHHHHHHQQHWSPVSMGYVPPSPQVWSSPGDCSLQRVPDALHQELSPYIITPTTPLDTPDSEYQPETPVTIFSFDWNSEQHVPNIRGYSFRNSSSSERRSVHQVQPITLQLPRKKHLAVDPASNHHQDYAK